MSRWTAQRLYERARLSWVNLGFRLDHIQPRVYTQVPIVLYPSIYLSRRKHPEQFFRVLEQVRKAVPHGSETKDDCLFGRKGSWKRKNKL